jgi:hypothetical protein
MAAKYIPLEAIAGREQPAETGLADADHSWRPGYLRHEAALTRDQAGSRVLAFQRSSAFSSALAC